MLCFIAPVLKLVSSTIINLKIALISLWNDFSVILWENVFLRGELQIDAQKSNLKGKNETAFCEKSLSIPLKYSTVGVGLGGFQIK